MRNHALLTMALAAAFLGAAGFTYGQRFPRTPPVPPEAPTTAAADIPATIVSVRLKEAAPEELFDALGSQAKTRFATSPPDLWDRDDMQKPVSADIDKVPFLEALRRLCDLSHLGVQAGYGDASRQYVLSPATPAWGKRPALVVGPFLVTAVTVQV